MFQDPFSAGREVFIADTWKRVKDSRRSNRTEGTATSDLLLRKLYVGLIA